MEYPMIKKGLAARNLPGWLGVACQEACTGRVIR